MIDDPFARLAFWRAAIRRDPRVADSPEFLAEAPAMVPLVTEQRYAARASAAFRQADTQLAR